MKNFPKRYSCPFHYRGSILVFSVWVLTFFSILSVAIFNIVSAQLRLNKAIEDRIVSSRLARAAFIYARANNKMDTTSYDTLAELRQEQAKEFGGLKFVYTLVDEESKINLNTSSIALLARLPGVDLDVAEKIFTSDLKPFVRKEEVLLVEGVTEEMFNGFQDIVTVHSSGKININTVGPEALKVLGCDQGLVDIIVGFRNGPDEDEATGDDGVFEDPGGILNKLRAYTMLSGSQEVALLQVMSLLCTDSVNFSLEVKTSTVGKPVMKYSIVMDANKIKQWSE
ncbi:MAG: helix-hairpin-helix domain-containing protein [Candidatus Omnitrophica bacterium]|nr:helix-hairpin-helix domain-containing protein [Candidatus Omnitrophota bacterium]